MSTRDVRYGPLAAVGQAIDETADKTLLTLSLLKKMIFGQVSMKNLSGPITIAEVAGDSARMGLTYFLGVLALRRHCLPRRSRLCWWRRCRVGPPAQSCGKRPCRGFRLARRLLKPWLAPG